MGLIAILDSILSYHVLPLLMRSVQILLVFLKPFSDTLLDAFSTIFIGSKKLLPPIRNELLLLSATELAEKIRKKEVSALSVMQAYVERMREVQPQVNAFIDHRFEDALSDAKAVDKMLASRLKTEAELQKQLPLLGVPFSCKEIVGVKGLAQTNGLRSFKDRKAPDDSQAARQYREAGALPVVVTNIPTMLLWWDTSNPAFGATRNPYDGRRSAGGSSGGEAVLISSAGSVIGIGSDLGGSIRLPCAFCGIYGHKPSQGLISIKTAWDLELEAVDPYMTIGPMCRYVEDLTLLTRILASDHKKHLLDQKVDFKKVKVYYMESFPGPFLSATTDVRAAVRKAVKHFEEAYQARPTDVRIEELKDALLIWKCVLFDAAGPLVRKAIADESGHLNLMWEYLKCTFGCSDYDYRLLFYAATEVQQKDKAFNRCLEMYASIKKKIEDLFTEDAILILPTHPEPPPHPFTTIPKFENMGYTALFNLLGCPGTQVPAGLSGGLPIGLQVVSGKDMDHLTLAAALELDQVFGGWKSPSQIKI